MTAPDSPLPPGMRIIRVDQCVSVPFFDDEETGRVYERVVGKPVAYDNAYLLMHWQRRFGATLALFIMHVRSICDVGEAVAISYADLANRMGISERQVQRCVAYWRDPSAYPGLGLRGDPFQLHPYFRCYVQEIRDSGKAGRPGSPCKEFNAYLGHVPIPEHRRYFAPGGDPQKALDLEADKADRKADGMADILSAIPALDLEIPADEGLEADKADGKADRKADGKADRKADGKADILSAGATHDSGSLTEEDSESPQSVEVPPERESRAGPEGAPPGLTEEDLLQAGVPEHLIREWLGIRPREPELARKLIGLYCLTWWPAIEWGKAQAKDPIRSKWGYLRRTMPNVIRAGSTDEPSYVDAWRRRQEPKPPPRDVRIVRRVPEQPRDELTAAMDRLRANVPTRTPAGSQEWRAVLAALYRATLHVAAGGYELRVPSEDEARTLGAVRSLLQEELAAALGVSAPLEIVSTETGGEA